MPCGKENKENTTIAWLSQGLLNINWITANNPVFTLLIYWAWICSTESSQWCIYMLQIVNMVGFLCFSKEVSKFLGIWRYFSLLGILYKYSQTSISMQITGELMAKWVRQYQCKRTPLGLHSVWILLVLWKWFNWRWVSYGQATSAMLYTTTSLAYAWCSFHWNKHKYYCFNTH